MIVKLNIHIKEMETHEGWIRGEAVALVGKEMHGTAISKEYTILKNDDPNTIRQYALLDVFKRAVKYLEDYE